MAAPSIGTVFSRLTVASEPFGRYRVMCRCSCGVEKDVRYDHLVSGKTVSCGCQKVESTKLSNTTHGLARSPEYAVYKAMINRCHKPSKQSHNYKDRGIYVCDRWRESFENFIADMGRRPGGEREYTVERRDNNGPYEPGNCYWATYKVQGNNRRTNRLLTYKGRTQTLVMWAEETGVNQGTLLSRLDRQGLRLGQALGLEP